MKTYQLVFHKNCESMLREIAQAWNEDSVLGKLGYIEEEASKKKVYDVSALSQVCLSVVTSVASAIIYDGLKKVITGHLKKTHIPNSEVRITLNETRSTIFISLEPNEKTNEEVEE